MDWIRTEAGLQMAKTIIMYLPRITVCLEEIALTLKENSIEKYKEDILKLDSSLNLYFLPNLNPHAGHIFILFFFTF